MTRFIGQPDSIFGGNPGFLAEGILNGFITGNVAAGELCTLFESACIKRTDQTLPWSSINNDGTTPVVVVFPPTLITNLVLTTQTVFKCCGRPRRHPSGIFIVPVQTSAGIGFIIRSSSGQQFTNFVLISSDVSVTIPHVTILSNGNFVIHWIVSSSLKHCVIQISGTGFILGTITTVTSICATSGLVPWLGQCQLANGNYVITFTTTGNHVQGVVYTNAGVIVGSIFDIDTSNGGVHHATQPCANGDFVHYCFDSAHSVFKVWRITATGTIVWGPITPSGCGTAVFGNPDAARIHPPENRICELPSSHHICVALPNTSNFCNGFLLNGTTGALIQRCDVGQDFCDVNFHHPICFTPSGFCMAHSISRQVNTFISFFDGVGNPIHLNVPCDSGGHSFSTADNPVVHCYLGFSNAAVCISRYARSANSSVHLRCIHTDVRGTRRGDGDDFQPFGPSDCNSPAPVCDVDGSAFFCHFSTGSVQLLCTQFQCGRSSVLGVAQASATDGQAVTIIAEGYFKLPATQVFGPGVAFDRRQAIPLGPRGVVGGQNAILFGWV